MSSTTVTIEKPKRQRRTMTEEEKLARRVAKALKKDESDKLVQSQVVTAVRLAKKTKSPPIVVVATPNVEVTEPPRKKRASKKTQTPPSVTVPVPSVNQTQAPATANSNYTSFVLDVAKLLADAIIQGQQFNVYTSDDPQWTTVKDEVVKSAA